MHKWLWPMLLTNQPKCPDLVMLWLEKLVAHTLVTFV